MSYFSTIITKRVISRVCLINVLFSLISQREGGPMGAVILLLKVEKLPNVRSALRTEAARLLIIREAWDLLCTLLHNHKGHDRNVRALVRR